MKRYIRSLTTIFNFFLILTTISSSQTYAQNLEDEMKININSDRESYSPGQSALFIISGNLNSTIVFELRYNNHTLERDEIYNVSMAPAQYLWEIDYHATNGSYYAFAYYIDFPEVNTTTKFEILTGIELEKPLFSWRLLEMNVSILNPNRFGKGLLTDYNLNITNLHTAESIYIEDVDTYALFGYEDFDTFLLFVPGNAIKITADTNNNNYIGSTIIAAEIGLNIVTIKMHNSPTLNEKIRGAIAIPLMAIFLIYIILRNYKRNKYRRMHSDTFYTDPFKDLDEIDQL